LFVLFYSFTFLPKESAVRNETIVFLQWPVSAKYLPHGIQINPTYRSQ